ncbi:MAG: IS607 family transposase [Pseudomonadota bacterium]|nr:IS607 family transposase [Pseudomonadota bacterium]
MPSRKAAEQLGCHPNTLRKWANEGKIPYIKTESGQRRYNVEAFIGKRASAKTLCYCRVSSPKQRDDLERQIEFMRERYPQAERVKDIERSRNFKRKGLLSVLQRAMQGDKLKVVVAHRDRLARFGFDLIKYIVEKNAGEVVVLDQTTDSPEEELSQDLLNILQVFSCRMHGLRNDKKQIHQALSNPKTTKNL